MNIKSLFIALICIASNASAYSQNATIRIRNNSLYSVTVILEGTDDDYDGCSAPPSYYCSWIESNPITIPASSGWATYADPSLIECAYGWANCTFTGYGACAGSGSVPSSGTWTTIWRNARITINPLSGCTTNTTCIEDPTYGTFAGSCAGFSVCSHYVTWTRVLSSTTPKGDQIDIEIF